MDRSQKVRKLIHHNLEIDNERMTLVMTLGRLKNDLKCVIKFGSIIYKEKSKDPSTVVKCISDVVYRTCDKRKLRLVHWN